jgi:serine/threonine protein kinase
MLLLRNKVITLPGALMSAEWNPDITVDPLAVGGSSKIFYARINGVRDTRFVVKWIKGGHAVTAFAREIQALRSIPTHPHLVRMLGHADHSLSDLFILMERGPDTTLESLDDALSPDNAFWLTRALFFAVAHMHSHGWAHCDLKAENVLVDVAERRLLLIDFGLTRKAGQYLTQSMRATRVPASEHPLYACSACGAHKLHLSKDVSYTCSALDCRYTETLDRRSIGTPYYMPLEMLNAANDDAPAVSTLRSDLFSVALVAVRAHMSKKDWAKRWHLQRSVGQLRLFRKKGRDVNAARLFVKSAPICTLLCEMLNTERPCDRPLVAVALQRLGNVS